MNSHEFRRIPMSFQARCAHVMKGVCRGSRFPKASMWSAVEAAYTMMMWGIFEGIPLSSAFIMTIAVVHGGSKIVKSLQKMEHIMQSSLYKLTMLEQRLEHLVEPGAEAARHVMNIVQDYNGDGCGWRTQWPRRMISEVYSQWLSARQRQGDPWSKRAWSL